ncbi:4-hydroxythreonine-4-phosphate dehydrogenase PdxA [Phreatobacter aquaticus]|uniref:4-hydroxythreonine-4-phosphate dehydrogenase n=1 Tax=Phreatobacter aquaticus TaxID=2570229 RepID=A0A4D7QQ18_9HYPH|nr:4-hydroxythreonine-4-phosphate dehydrogenase PdxA [Phreatobacter aquaticus]QCK87017.1 4-hydroxythreonine-4-phosphate dehydrogenase PdxA [Phreatobacter aquaticus]
MLPLAVTMGEPAGIGPDIALMAWRDRAANNLPPFYLIGDPDLMEARAARLGIGVPVVPVEVHEAFETFPYGLPVVAVSGSAADRPGVPDPATGGLVIESIRSGVEDVRMGRARAIVTNPIAKSVLAAAGFAHPGHTEYLGELARTFRQGPSRPVMLIWSRDLAVVPVTIHMPLAEVPQRLTKALIVDTAAIVDHDMRTRFGMARPRLAICGLNPHAGEDGLLGHEEDDVIRPAIAELKALGIDATGPYPADTLFHPAARATYDVALGMYHDQVLVPVKTLAFDTGVNVTLGLPFVRTSPDHGTAFSLAGTGRARPSSLIEAIALAGRLTAPGP